MMNNNMIKMIEDTFQFNKDLMMEVFLFFYNRYNENEEIKEEILKIFNKYNYCIQCGTKMNEKYKCPLCDK